MITSAEEFYKLRTSDNPEEYIRAAWDEAPIEVWRDILEKYEEMHFWVAQNKSVPIEILDVLSDSCEWRVRHMIGSKNRITENLQMKLSNDKEVLVRRSIVSNKKTVLRVLQVLANDEDEEIRSLARDRIEKHDYKN
jgi:hypothetical protein